MSEVKRVAIYARRSREHGNKDVSIREQTEACQRWSEKHGFSVTLVYEERQSGASGENRAEFQRALSDAQAGKFEILLTYDLTRFGRTDTDEAGHWRYLFRTAGVEIVHIMDADKLQGEAGEIVRPILQAGAHEYLKQVARASTRGHIAAVERGSWPSGKAPFGYRVEVRAGERGKWLVVYEPEAKIVRLVFELRAEGAGYATIARKLNLKNIPAPKGIAWSHAGVHALLHNHAYVGTLARGARREGYKPHARGKFYRMTPEGPAPAARVKDDEGGVIREDAVPALVSHETWDKVMELSRQRVRRPTGGFVKGLLTGLCRCSVCGGLVSRNGSKPANRPKAYRYYQCLKRKYPGTAKRSGGCRGVSVSDERIEPAVLQAIRGEVGGVTPERVAVEVKKLLGAAAPRVDVSELENRRRALERRRDELLLGGDLTSEFMRAGLERLQEEHRKLGREIEGARSAESRSMDVGKSVARVVEAARRVTAPNTEEGREALREVVHAWVVKIVVYPSEKPGAPVPIDLIIWTPAGAAFTATPSTYTDARILDTRGAVEALAPGADRLVGWLVGRPVSSTFKPSLTSTTDKPQGSKESGPRRDRFL